MSETAVKHTKVNLFDFFFANKTRKTYTNIGISLLLIIVFLVFALRPTISTVGTIKKKIEDYEKYNVLAEKKITAAKNLQNQLNLSSAESPDGLKDEIAFLDKVYMYDYSLKTIYQNIVTRAKQTNVAIRGIIPAYKASDLTDLGFDNQPLSPSLTKFDVEISIEGKDMSSVEAFLGTLEGHDNFPILSRVASINLTDGISGEKLKEQETQKASADALKVVAANINLVIYLDSTRLPEELKK